MTISKDKYDAIALQQAIRCHAAIHLLNSFTTMDADPRPIFERHL